MKTLILIVAACLATFTAHAAPDERPPEMLDLVHQVERLAAGKPLPVVVVADRLLERPVSVVAANPDGLLATLQDLGEAYSSPEPTDIPAGPFLEVAKARRIVYQPFAFNTTRGQLWTVANARMWTPAQAMERPLGRVNRAMASAALFHAMDAAQLAKAGGPGLRWADLQPGQQAAMRSLLDGPWGVEQRERNEQGRYVTRYASASPRPLDVEKLVLRLFVGFDTLAIEASGGESGEPARYGLEAKRPTLAVTSDSVTVARYLPQAPHALKPSDLDYAAPALQKPVGIEGISTVGKLVEAAAALSGLPLVVDARWKKRAIFVGDARMPAGEVLRALAFSVDGAWRRVERTYLFTWDRAGLAAEDLRTDMAGAAQNLTEMLGFMQSFRDVPPDWTRTVLQTLPADPELPLKPNTAQINALLAPFTGDVENDEEAASRVGERNRQIFNWNNLDTRQQMTVRDALDAGRLVPYSKAPPLDSPMLNQARLSLPSLQATLEIPGVGIVDASSVLGTVFTDTDGASEALKGYRERLEDAEKKKRAERLKTPIALKQPVRALEAPPLPPGEWPRLLDQMRRKGLNTLYVPVFWDGMAIFPTTHFPLQPLCGGRDVLADVLQEARARNIRVVAALHTLAWRMPGSKVHWLDQRPELVDVNALGQGRRAWAASFADPMVRDYLGYEPGGIAPLNAATYADYVRPDLPAVRSRLLGLLSDLRAYKGLAGIALVDWTRLTGTTPAAPGFRFGETGPPLGYTAEDRAAFLRKSGVDPLDITPTASLLRYTRDLPPENYIARWASFRFAQDAALATELLREVEKSWPGGSQLISFTQPGQDITIPAADVAITWEASAVRGHKSTYRRVTLPVSLDLDRLLDEHPPDEKTAAAQRLDNFRLRLLDAASSASARGIFKADGVVLDFTAAPDMLWEGLKLLPDVKR